MAVQSQETLRDARPWDVAIVGAGPSGSVLALRLAQLGHRVLLLERDRFPRRHLGESLTPGVKPLLQSCGAESALLAGDARAVGRIQVSWGPHSGPRDDPPAGGCIVDRAGFDHHLLKLARAAGVRVLQPAHLECRQWTGNRWTLRIVWSGRRISAEAHMLADASGRARALGGHRRKVAPSTVALYAYWRGSSLPHEPVMESGRNSWFWGVPLPDGSYNTLAFVDREALQRSRTGPLGAWFGDRLAESRLLSGVRNARRWGPVRAMDATPYLADPVASPRCLRIGDAAVAIDPLSSSGVQKAIQAALAGAVVLHTMLRRPNDRHLALQFHRESLERTSRRHLEWARGFYATVAAHNPTPFWTARAKGASTPKPEVPFPENPSTLLTRSPAVSIQLEPVLGSEFVERRAAVRRPDWDGSIAFLGGRELAPLVADFPPVLAAGDVARWYESRVGPDAAPAVAAWLVRRGVLVPARPAPDSE